MSAAVFGSEKTKKTAGLGSGPRFQLMLFDPAVYGGHASLRKLRHRQFPSISKFLWFVNGIEIF